MTKEKQSQNGMLREKWNAIFAAEGENIPSSIGGINRLSTDTKRKIYSQLIPKPILVMFQLSPDLFDQKGRDLLELKCQPGSSIAELALYHRHGFIDPVVYGQITDTISGQVHVMLYMINDPESARFNVDRMPDGSPTEFGVIKRNISAEIRAMRAGLAPGQIRSGLRMMKTAIRTFEEFTLFLGHDRFFAEPLYYHNAVILERAGFSYLRGKKLMERINNGFELQGELRKALDGSTPFRMPDAAQSIRLRSWAIHDGLLKTSFSEVTMYKIVGKNAGLSTTYGIEW